MITMDQLSAGFEEYLESRIMIDDASINRTVAARLQKALKDLQRRTILDLGTGTGAMIRRLISGGVDGAVRFVGLDSNPTLLEAAKRHSVAILSGAGYTVTEQEHTVRGERAARVVAIDFIAGDFFGLLLEDTFGPEYFDLVSANGFFDLLPPAEAVSRVRYFLKPGGYVYFTTNYDGRTELLPFFEDREFERDLWRVYNRSMDDRTVNGKPIAGSGSGSIVYDALVKGGFEILAYGSSDWVISPGEESYSPQEAQFLRAMVRTVYEEGCRHPEIDPRVLDRWLSDRADAVETCTLALMVHQTDVLARALAR